MSNEQSAMIHIKRAFKLYGMAAYDVIIDDKKVGYVKNGQESWFGVSAGRHLLRLKQIWQDVSETVVLDAQARETIHLECGPKFAFKFPYSYLTETNEIEKLEVDPQITIDTPNVMVKFLSEYEKLRVASEEVEVPRGVTIRVKRSRSVEHVIEMGQQSTRSINVDAGILKIINTSIHGEIQKKQNKAYRQTETIEYEIELNGNISNRYELVWVDVWQKGVVEIKRANLQVLPFQIRERTELQVLPVE